MTSPVRSVDTAQGFLATQPASGESGERSIDMREREAFEVLAAGTVVAGKYRVKGELGRGGFAVVYDAEHIDLRRDVALKVLHRSEGTPAVLIERFAREVRISALVRHPHVLEVFDAGSLPDGSPFLVMEKIHGATLHHHLYLAKKLGIREAIELSRQLLSALVALAERGIVHRDIKPENLMLTRDEAGELQLKLVDFGIALVRNDRLEGLHDSFEPRLTMQGALIGTPHYMAPEQLRSELVDARVDIYATGVVMYQAITGSMPFDGADLSSLTLNVLHGNARSLRELRRDCPPRLARLIERALQRDPACRYASAVSMLAALQQCTDQPTGSKRAREYLAPLVLPTFTRVKRLSIAVLVLGGWLLSNQPSRPLSSAAGLSASLAAPAAEAAAPARAAELTITPLSPEVLAVPASEPLAGQHVGRDLPVDGAKTATVVQADQAKATALTRKALALYLHGELPAAYTTYRRAAHANPQEPTAFRGIGLSASRLGKTREARRAFNRYLELSPRAADAELVKARLAALDQRQASR